MLEIKAAILDELDTIEVAFDKYDNSDVYVLQAGMIFPLIKISATVINTQDILTFSMKIGQQKLPIVQFSIDDSLNMFRTSDCIDENTDILIWLGSARADIMPTKLCFESTDTYARQGTIRVTAKLKMPRKFISVHADTVSNMLTEFCDKSGLGLRFCSTDFKDVQIVKNYANVMPEQFLDAFCNDCGFNWFIDNHYNVCIYNLADILDEHKTLTCNVDFESMHDLQEPVDVRVTNKIGDRALCLYNDFGYDYLNVDNYVQKRQIVEFDKSAKVDENTELITEHDIEQRQPIYDLSKLCIDLLFVPYLLFNRTFDVQVYTDSMRTKRESIQDYDAKVNKPVGQILIEDLSGIHLLSAVEYKYPGTDNRLQAICSFEKLPDTN